MTDYNLMNGCFDAMCQQVADRVIHHVDSTGMKKKSRYCSKHFRQYSKQLDVVSDHPFTKFSVKHCDCCDDDYLKERFGE